LLAHANAYGDGRLAISVAFNKFDPHRPDEPTPMDPSARRRALLLKYGWWVTVVYTALGFGLMVYWVLRG
jgi:hypothetical protein